MGGRERRDPAEPETSPTPGALTGAGSQDSVGRAGWLDTRAAGREARLGLCQAFHRAAFLPMPLSRGRALCRVRRRACRWPGGERPLSPPRLWQKEMEASWPPLSRGCQARSVWLLSRPSTRSQARAACFLATGISYQLQRLLVYVVI